MVLAYLLVEAQNAFNFVNRVAALWNARILWPQVLVQYFFTVVALSREGVTQGDPLSMLMYSITVLPLIH